MFARKLAAVLLAITMVSCGGRRPGDPLRPGYNLYSKDQDIQLGREVAQQVRQQAPIVNNQRLQQYVRDLGNRLAQQPGADDYPYEFTLINDPSINAFALPGGPIFIHSGLIGAAENEGHVVGVLAHEIAHVALRHGTSQASRAGLLQFPAALASVILGQGSVGAQLGQAGLGFGMNVLMLRYSRSAEEEADALGARIMASAGYNPLEMARFFEMLEAQGGSRAPQFLSSHPNPGNRVQNVQAEIQTLPQGTYDRNVTSAQFREAKQLVAGLPKPDPGVQRARAAAANVPSFSPQSTGNFQTLNTNRFTLAYPQGWGVFGDRTSDTITVAPQEGLAKSQLGGVSVGYGVITGYYTPAQRGTTVDQAQRDLLAQLRSIDPSVRVDGSARNVRVGGSTGAVINLVSGSPFGGNERNVLLTVPRPEGLFYMIFIAPDQHFQQVQNTFNTMVQSLRFRG